MHPQQLVRIGTTPTYIAADNTAQRIVIPTTGTVYYGDDKAVTAATGKALAVGSGVTIGSGMWFVASSEQRVQVSDSVSSTMPERFRDRGRLSYNLTDQRAEWHDPGYVTLQDFYEKDYTWQNTLGASVSNSSLSVCENTVQPFTKADEGKYVVVNRNIGGREMKQIGEVDYRGRAIMTEPFTSSATGTRIAWGFDAGTKISDAMNEMVSSNTNPKVFRTPGWYRCPQVLVPNGIKWEGSGWGNSMGPSETSLRDAATAGTLIQQMPDANVDFIRFTEGIINPAFTAHWIGPLWITDMLLHGPETDLLGQPYTTGWGMSLKNEAGDVSFGIEDGFWLDNIQFGFFYSGGLLLPAGCGPGRLGCLRFWYNGGVGLKYVHNNTQALEIEYVSGDGNGNGLVQLQGITGSSGGPATIGIIKSEKGNYFDVPSGSTDYQDKALILESCTGSIHVGTIDHFSSVPLGDGTTAPGPAVRINTSVPKFSWNQINVRLRGIETDNVANAVGIHDQVNLVDVPLENVRMPGVYPRGIRDDLPNESKTVVASVPRESCNGSITCTSGALLLSFFTATKDITIDTVRMFSTGTAAGATPTVVRVGLFTVQSDGSLGLVHFTSNNTSYLSSTNTKYEIALDGSYALVAGKRYATGVLVVTGAAAPTILGNVLQAQFAKTDGPLIGAVVTGQTNLPDTVAAVDLVASENRPYVELVP